MIVTVTTENGETKRVSLPKPAWTGRDAAGTGCWRTAIYIGQRSKRVIVETDSIWEDTAKRDGSCVGARYHMADANEIAQLAYHYNLGDQIDDKILGTEEL